jgi:putative zinc metallopeptidase
MKELTRRDSISLNGEEIEFYYTKKKMKNINIRIKKDNQIYVSMPKYVSIDEVKRLLISKANWIMNIRRKYEEVESLKENKVLENDAKVYLLGSVYLIYLVTANQNEIKLQDGKVVFYLKPERIYDEKYKENLYKKWITNLLKEEICGYVNDYCNLLKTEKIPVPEIVIRQMKSKWGSCMPAKKKVTFNLSLAKVPQSCIEYVVLHELSHFKYQSHDKKFYQFVEQYMPDWKQRRKLLNDIYSKIV